MSDKKTSKKANKLVVVTALTVLILTIILGFNYLPRDYDILRIRNLLTSVEDMSMNWRFASKSLASQATAMGTGIKRSESIGYYKKILIAGVDDASIKNFGSYPLDRKVWTELLTNFNSKDPVPEVVLFDIFFPGPDANPKTDKALVKAFQNYKGFVGEDIMLYTIDGVNFDNKKDPNDLSVKEMNLFLAEGLNYESPEVQALKKFELNIPRRLKNVKKYSRVLPVLPDLAKVSTFSGSVNMDSQDNKDEVFRKKSLIVSVYYYLKQNGEVKITNVYYPSVVLALAAKILKSDLKNIEVDKNTIVIRDAVIDGKKTDFVIPVDDHYRLAVNYRSKPGSGYIRIISLKDIFRAGLPRNAIVLVGVNAHGTAPNIWGSPLGTMFSVEHLGYALGTILNRDFIQEVPEWLNIAYIIILTLLVGFLVSRGIRSTIVAFFLSIAIPFGVGFALFQFNIQINTMLPLITSVLALIVGEIYILLTEGKEKKYIKSTFSKYVNPDLVNILIQNPDMIQLGGKDVDATILFSDIRGFTTLSEGMSPMELISFLNIYLSRMTDIVMETHGTLDKYIGDAVVAFWGTPIDLPNHALNGCQAAVRMIQGLKQFNEEQAKLGKKPINIGIGLNSGCITVGNIGSDKKKNYTAIGENTQLAEDLQDENKVYHTNIIISEYTYEKVKEHVVTRELDLIHVKGEEKPIRIYELLDVNKWD